MSDLLYTWQFTIPAGTLAASPASLSLLVPPTVVERFDVRVPPGPRGQVGWQLWFGGGQMFPFTSGTWIVADDTVVPFRPPTSYTSGAWSLVGYNTGVFNHTLYIEGRLLAYGTTPLVVPETEALAIE